MVPKITYSSLALGGQQRDSDEPNEISPSATKNGLMRSFLDGLPSWNTPWRLQTVVVGSFILSLACAGAHCWFFMHLDGRILLTEDLDIGAKKTTIPQNYVTTISLLLTTASRAALLASVSICYTQYLWATVRDRALKVGLVEDLFQIQTNAFHLISPGIYIKTPVLAAVAVFCWLIPIATVYPPGALIVDLQSLPIGTNFNVSAMHVQDPTIQKDTLSIIWCYFDRGSIGSPTLLAEEEMDLMRNVSFLDTCYLRTTETEESININHIVRSCLMSGELARLPQPTEGNSSYSLSFWGTSLECKVAERTIEKKFFNSDVLVGNQRFGWATDQWMLGNFTSNVLESSFDPLYLAENTTIIHRVAKRSSEYHYYPCLDKFNGSVIGDPESGSVDLPDSGINIFIPVTETVCHPKIARYSATISHSAGKQDVSLAKNEDSHPAYTSKFSNFNGSYKQWVQLTDAMAVYDSFSRALNKSARYNKIPNFKRVLPHGGLEPFITDNGTSVDACRVYGGTETYMGDPLAGLEIWPLSVFERRFPSKGSAPSFDVNIANELLMNSTVSMLAMNKRFEMARGTKSHTFNIYRFKGRMAFFLPYGICLGLGIPVIAIGLYAFYARNQGVSAITGGFIQLLITTTGRTSLENIVTRTSGTVGGYENISEELRETKVRFGELVENMSDQDGGMGATNSNSLESPSDSAKLVSDVAMVEKNTSSWIRVGFGLPEEVRPLRRRN